MTIIIVVEALAIAILAVLVVGLLRSHAEILRRLYALGAGETDHQPVNLRTGKGVAQPRPQPTEGFDIVGTRPGGSVIKIGVAGADHATLLAFLSSGCSSCGPFWESLAGDLQLPGRNTRLVIVTKDPSEESPSRIADLAPPDIPVVMSSKGWQDYRVPVSPYFLLIDGLTGRTLGEGAGRTWPQVESLLRQAIAESAPSDSSDSSGKQREARTDQELLAAGILPGDPSLYPHRSDP